MDKSSDAFRTISEVADDLDLPQHVLRFWETRFAQIRPMKRGGGRRYYRPEDVDLLKGIRRLLYGEGYTIKGVQRILKEQGVRAVVAIGDGNGALDAATRARLGAGGEGDFGAGDDGFGDVEFVSAEETERTPRPALDPSARAADATDLTAERMAQRFAPDARSSDARSSGGRMTASPAARPPVVRRDAPFEEPAQTTRSPFAPVVDRFRGVVNRLSPDAAQGPAEEETAAPSGLTRDELRRLQATLFELLECKRLLDLTR